MKVHSSRQPCPVNVESDGYVPVMARFQDDFGVPPVYWRTGDFKKTLVEFGIDPESGAICKVTVTSVNGVSDKSLPKLDFELSTLQEGIPCTDTSVLEGKPRIDIENAVRASLENDELIVRFGDGSPTVENSVRCGQVAFLVDDEGTLCGVGFSKFSGEQVENLRFSTGETVSTDQ